MEGKDRNLMAKRCEKDVVTPLREPGGPMETKVTVVKTLWFDVSKDAEVQPVCRLPNGQQRIGVVFAMQNVTWRERLRFRVAQVLVWLLDR